MTPLMLRQLWSLIEATQSSLLLKLDDPTLVQWLLKQLRSQQTFDQQQANVLADYICARLPLIRDLAQERLVVDS